MKVKTLRVLLVVAGLTAATEVRAQERAAAFEQLGKIVKPGQELVVTDSEGRAVKGNLVSASERELVIARPRFLREAEQLSFQAGAISKVSRSDSLWNGGLIGVAVGVVGAAVIANTNEWNPDYGAEGAFLIYGAALGAAGLGVGMGVDAVIRPTIYESPKARTRVQIAPLVQRGRKGILASLRF